MSQVTKDDIKVHKAETKPGRGDTPLRYQSGFGNQFVS